MADKILVEALRKHFGSTLAVADLSFAVREGSVTGFLGPNGAGKTTTLRVLLGLVTATAGRATIDGQVYRTLDHPTRKVGAVLEGANYHPGRSGRNHLRVVASAGGLDCNRIDEMLSLVGLEEFADKRVSGYSLGMKQRLGLAGALLLPRRLVVLDEPTNGLDPAGTRDVRGIISDLHAGGATVVVSSHLLTEVEATCTHVAVLQSGALIAEGELRLLLDADSTGLVIATPDADLAVSTLLAAGVAAYRDDADEPAAVVPAGDPPEVIALLVRAGVAVHEARRRRPRLEELFARLTEGAP